VKAVQLSVNQVRKGARNARDRMVVVMSLKLVNMKLTQMMKKVRLSLQIAA
jgi:hypothetical protein